MNEQPPTNIDSTIPILPRVIRAKYAPMYLGMSRSVFNSEVKPCVISVPIGRQGVGYDRLDLDAWWEHHKQRNGCSAIGNMGDTLCHYVNIEEAESTGAKGENFGLSTKSGKESVFSACLTQITQMKPKRS